MSKSDKRISQHTERMAGEFLFDKDEMAESKFLDMRTRIKSEATMRALLFYALLSEKLESDVARKIKDAIERMLIAYNGEGRTEAVEVLKQQFPKRVEIDKGYERT